jgi:endo-1,4-beta-D-glucanase Y
VTRLRQTTVVLTAAVVVALVAVVLVRAGGPSRAAAGAAQKAPPAVHQAAEYFLSHYELADGRVVRWDQGGDTVSEGQAYAMLVALAVGDRNRFQAAWSWSRQHLLQPDGLLDWRFANEKVTGGSAAADADMDTAWALSLAAQRYPQAGYGVSARALSSAILSHEVQYVDGQPVLLAGPWAAGPAPTVDPSYLAAVSDMSALAALDSRWTKVASNSLRLLGELMAGGHLPSDWAIVVPDGTAHPTSPPGQPGGPVAYGFDAVRVPIRLAAGCQSQAGSMAARLWPTLSRADRGQADLVGLDLGGSALATASPSPVGEVGAAGAAAADGAIPSADHLLAVAQYLNGVHPTYFSSAWVALGRILLQTKDLGTCRP